MGVARKGSKSVTFYLAGDLDDILIDFAAKTFRTKSNAVELLIRKALETIGDYNEGIDFPDRPTIDRRKPGDLLDRPAKKPGRKPKAKVSPVEDDIEVGKPVRKTRKPAKQAATPATPAAPATKRGRPRKTAAA